MSALATFLRQRTVDDVNRLTAAERIRLALALGDDDLRLFCAATGLDVHEARRRLVATRQHGRRPSAIATKP